MDVKIDIKDTIDKSVGVCTKFGSFWKGLTFPDNIGPALSFMIVIGILPFVGYLLSGIMWIFWLRGLGFASVLLFAIVSAIVYYVFYVVWPPIMGAILGALDPSLGVNKAKAPGYTTVLAYSAAPAAIGALFIFIPVIGWIIALAGGIIAIINLWLGLTAGLGLDSGQAIIMILIMILITAIVGWLITGMILGSIMFGMFLRPF